jgi:hypothetical protein
MFFRGAGKHSSVHTVWRHDVSIRLLINTGKSWPTRINCLLEYLGTTSGRVLYTQWWVFFYHVESFLNWLCSSETNRFKHLFESVSFYYCFKRKYPLIYMKIYMILRYKDWSSLSLKLFNHTVQILIPHIFDKLRNTRVWYKSNSTPWWRSSFRDWPVMPVISTFLCGQYSCIGKENGK